MTNRSSRGSDEPEKAVALRRSINDGELIRELHQGQRPCEPQYKAVHMAAPDQSVKTPRALLPRRRRPHMALRAQRIAPAEEGKGFPCQGVFHAWGQWSAVGLIRNVPGARILQ